MGALVLFFVGSHVMLAGLVLGFCGFKWGWCIAGSVGLMWVGAVVVATEDR